MSVRLAVIVLAAFVAGLPRADAAALETVRVDASAAGPAFNYTVEPRATAKGHALYRVNYPSPVVTDWTPNNTVPGDYYLPADCRPGGAPRPAVICLHILAGNFELERLVCSSFAARGVPAMMIKLPYYGERATPEGQKVFLRSPKRFVESLPQGLADVRRAVDVLASRPEIDARRIGVIGISLGGLTAAAAAEREPRLYRTAILLAGGDLPTIIHHARETRDLSRWIKALEPAERKAIDASVAEVDPLAHAEALRDRAGEGRVLLVAAANDEVIPPACTEKLAHALGIEKKIIWLEGLGHYTAIAALPRVMETAIAFFAQDLPRDVAPTKLPVDPPTKLVVKLLGDVAKLLAVQSPDKNGQRVELEAAVQMGAGKPTHGQLCYARGPAGLFRVDARLPGIAEVSLGASPAQTAGGRPTLWLSAGPQTRFEAAATDVASKAVAEPRHVRKIQMAAGLVASAAAAPQLLEQVAMIAPLADGTPGVTVTPQGRRESAVIRFNAERTAPSSVEVAGKGWNAKITVKTWQIDVPPAAEWFQPPAAAKVQTVAYADLERMFLALFNLAMERVE